MTNTMFDTIIDAFIESAVRMERCDPDGVDVQCAPSAPRCRARIGGVEGMEASYAGEVPLRRIGGTADFAEAALWLAGPSFVTGLNLHISGGNQLTRFPITAERPALFGLDPTSGA